MFSKLSHKVKQNKPTTIKLLFVLVFAGIGLIWLVGSQAASFSVDVEPEGANI